MILKEKNYSIHYFNNNYNFYLGPSLGLILIGVVLYTSVSFLKPTSLGLGIPFSENSI